MARPASRRHLLGATTMTKSVTSWSTKTSGVSLQPSLSTPGGGR